MSALIEFFFALGKPLGFFLLGYIKSKLGFFKLLGKTYLFFFKF